MKKLLVLAGGSQKNEAWGTACAEFFQDDFDLTCFLHYDHWETGEKNIDFAAEMEKVYATVEGTEEEGEWYVFAKSIGSILALKCVQEGIIKPKKCVFFGMPFNVVNDTVFAGNWSLLANFKVPGLAFHNDNDPTADYSFVTEKLNEYTQNVSVKTLSGDTHDYLNFTEYREDIESFLFK